MNDVVKFDLHSEEDLQPFPENMLCKATSTKMKLKEQVNEWLPSPNPFEVVAVAEVSRKHQSCDDVIEDDSGFSHWDLPDNDASPVDKQLSSEIVEFVVYDTRNDNKNNEVLIEHLDCYCYMLPNLLQYFDFAAYMHLYTDFSDLEYAFAGCPKQGLDRNCDRSVVKFVDMIINGENVMDWDTVDVLDYMETWSINLYSHAKNKLDEGYATPFESTGHDYHDHNNMECTFGKRKGGKRVKKQKH
ncbi:hypothetical protein K7X08_002431 [Anisodus acutangulus]|uniref:Uncharacterized protein n=1 Tax=Anisodus acutangulus TaxID=402998 RepID=A0A9Q1LRI8_9SOLA|nr:hypothetical protein K7X08_002431 [Anisodus acutangulus]